MLECSLMVKFLENSTQLKRILSTQFGISNNASSVILEKNLVIP